MHSQSKRSRALTTRTMRLRNTQRGSILPLVVFSLMVMFAFLAFIVDVTRDIYTINNIRFAAQSAALTGYSYAANNPDLTYTNAIAQKNITAAVIQTGNGTGGAWNMAPADGGALTGRSPVTFQPQDIVFIPNPNSSDANDFFVQVKARRDGSDGLKNIFLPVIYAFNSWSGGARSTDMNEAHPYRISEVISQPASRIGSGPPKNATDTRSADLAGCATFPLAISNVEFQTAAAPSQTQKQYTIDLVTAAQAAAPASPGHFKGCLVNVAPTGGNNLYYGDGQGNKAIDDLSHTLEYFAAVPIISAISPGVVERGSRIAAFDPANQTFQQRSGQLIAKLNQLQLNRYYIFPVIQSSPSFNGNTNTVIGFARLQLQTITSNKGSITVAVGIGDSVPVRNASFANGLATIPSVSGNLLPAPVAPFIARQLNAQTQGISSRPRGVVMAPSVSPRLVTTGG